jgi:hypothetical protein
MYDRKKMYTTGQWMSRTENELAKTAFVLTIEQIYSDFMQLSLAIHLLYV